MALTQNGPAIDIKEPMWASAKLLADCGIVFTITEISKNNIKWFLTLSLNESTIPTEGFSLTGSIPEGEEEAPLYEYAEFDRTKHKIILSLSRSDQRDDDFGASAKIIKEKGPMTNCVVNCIPLKGGRVFYDLCILKADDPRYVKPKFRPTTTTTFQGVDFSKRLKSQKSEPVVKEDLDFDPFIGDELP